MDITVTFTGAALPDIGIPAGSALVFRDVTGLQVITPAQTFQVSCAATGCAGCDAVHNRFTGTSRLRLEADGASDGLRWRMPEGA